MSEEKQIVVPEADADYLKKHHKQLSVPKMAKELRRAAVTVYGYMKALGLEPLKREPPGRDHYFRRANRRLEDILVHQRIVNSKRKKESK